MDSVRLKQRIRRQRRWFGKGRIVNFAKSIAYYLNEFDFWIGKNCHIQILRNQHVLDTAQVTLEQSFKFISFFSHVQLIASGKS